MTNPKKHTAYYVTALIDSGTANRRMNLMLGPFETWRAADAMVRPVEVASKRLLNGFTFASFSIEKISLPIEMKFRPGRLDLTDAVDHAWIDHCINWKGYSR